MLEVLISTIPEQYYVVFLEKCNFFDGWEAVKKARTSKNKPAERHSSLYILSLGEAPRVKHI